MAEEAFQSGVALRLPPQSKTLRAVRSSVSIPKSRFVFIVRLFQYTMSMNGRSVKFPGLVSGCRIVIIICVLLLTT